MQYIISLITMNVNSLVSDAKQVELKSFLTKYRPHLVLLSETKLSSRHRISLPNYNVYRNDRDSDGGGGNATLVRIDLKHEVINTPVLLSSEATCITLNLHNTKLTVVSFYCPSKLQKQDLSSLLQLDSNIVISGDFNAKHRVWNNTENNTNGNTLFKFLNEDNDLTIQHPDGPTFWRSLSKPSTIDIAVSRNVNISCTGTLQFHSDHDTVSFDLSLRSKPEYIAPISQFMFKKADWKKFKEIVNDKLGDIKKLSNQSDIDQCIGHITEVINHAMNEAIPKKSFKSENDFPPEIQTFIATKNKMRRKCYKTKNVALKSKINCLQKIIADRIDIYRSNILLKRLKSVLPNNDMFAKISKLLNQNSPQLQPFKMLMVV